MDVPAVLLPALLLGDGRFPSGAHAHSLGLETAVGTGLVADLGDLARWVDGQLGTTWRLDAAVAVLAGRFASGGLAVDGGAYVETGEGAGVDGGSWRRLDREVTARTTSPELRRVSRQLGRQLLRAAGRTWPSAALAQLPEVHPDGPHVAVVQGAAAAAAGLAGPTTAAVTVHGAVQLATSAAVRLLGLDPYAVVGLVADLGPRLEATCRDAAATSDDPAELPSAGAPMTDLLLAHHAVADGRLFAS
jgi:urease accessory protein